jgi:hypothetical protein
MIGYLQAASLSRVAAYSLLQLSPSRRHSLSALP